MFLTDRWYLFSNMKNYKNHILFLVILLIGSLFRFWNMNWDEGFHLHPDERFLTMVGNSMRIPNNLLSYLDPKVSTFNPQNINYPFFVYGTFPLVLNKIIVSLLNSDTYFQFTLFGRIVSAFFDLCIIALIYKTVELLEKKYRLSRSIKFLASFFYSITVFPIQLSHFFAVDTFLNFFMFASFYFILKYSFEKKISFLVFSAILMGLAFACKITAAFIFPLNMFFLFIGNNKNHISKIFTRKLFQTSYSGFILFLFYATIVYFTLRIADPYMFENSSILHPEINKLFIQNLKTLSTLTGKGATYPPTIQWINKTPILFSLTNIIVFGVGVIYFLFILIGFYTSLKVYKNIFRTILVWTIGFFLYQASQFAQSMRYFIPIYPFLAIFAGVGFFYLTKKWKKIFVILLLIVPLLYPLAFISIYRNETTRVTASKWIYKNIPDGSLLLGEHWDDPLPLLVTNTKQKQFISEALPVFDMDTNEKINKIKSALKKADYYILSSNRAWGSIPTVPEKYPLMSKFYKDLFNGKLQYKKIKEFASCPSFRYLGIPIDFPDDWAEEAFTVYDHPKVIIFKKNSIK